MCWTMWARVLWIMWRDLKISTTQLLPGVKETNLKIRSRWKTPGRKDAAQEARPCESARPFAVLSVVAIRMKAHL